MSNPEILLNKGENYDKNKLQDIGIKYINESNSYYFYRKDIYVYVFDKNNSKHPGEYKLTAIWED